MALVKQSRNLFPLAVQFTDPQAALNHAMALHREGQHAAAEGIYRQLLDAFPHSTDILHLLGMVEIDAGRVDEGFAKMREAIRLCPGVPHYHANLGARLLDRRNPEEAAACLREAIRLQPDMPTHYFNLGNACLQLRRSADAAEAYRQALRLQPDYPDSELQLGIALHSDGRRAEAMDWYRDVLARRPGHLAVATNLGAMLQEDCDLDGAARCFRQALTVDPTHIVPLNNLAVIHKDLGETAEAVRLLRRCTEIGPDAASIRSNLILVMHYDPDTTAEALQEQHRLWNAYHVRPDPAGHANPPDPRRRLRIGFISPDFRDHVVGRALLPSFRRHDHGAFEIFAYSVSPANAFGEAFKAAASKMQGGELGPEGQTAKDALDALPKLTTIIALGQVAHQSAVKACGEKLPKRRFAHGAVHKLLDGRTLIDSYHTSRYNQNTGRITEDMFDEVFALALG